MAAAFTARSAVSAQDIEYRQFRFEKVSCDAAISYKTSEKGLDIAVSAIAYGKGAEFKKWSVTDIRLNIDPERIRPDIRGKFYVDKESLFRYPAAIVFAAIGTQVGSSFSGLGEGITKAGATIGLGLLTLQAKGSIAGENSVFNLDWNTVDKIYEGRDFIEITVENIDAHLKEKIRVGLRNELSKEKRFDYSNMRQDEIMQMIETLEGQIDILRKNQEKYKSGINPEYEEIQQKIEELELERGMAYKTWLERQNI